MSVLGAKLRRDLWRMKGQAVAIGLVIAVGVLMQVMMSGLVNSLTETRAAYYDRYRLADVFAPLTRAPDRVQRYLEQIAGARMVETRVTGWALIDMPGQVLPLQAQAVSLPDSGEMRLNALYLTAGRMPRGGQGDEIVLLHSFAAAHGLVPGDGIEATMNGARHAFRIVGIAHAPEYLYTTAPGELLPDDARFGVIWMARAALAAAYDMDGAFNEALVALERGASEQAVLDAVDRVLAPYGGVGSYPRRDHTSDRFVSEEIAGLTRSAGFVPPIFMAVAAFLLYIVVSRIVQSEREEIGLMKAFGYTDWEVSAHYLRLVLVIAIGGAVAGCFMGIAAGRAMVDVYTQFYKFPFLVFSLEPRSFVSGVLVSVLAASAGGVLVLRQVFALTPAMAMRPPAPPDYAKSGRIGAGIAARMDQPSRMVLRRITRQPMRMGGAVVGIACGMALSVSMLQIHLSFAETLEETFSVIDRSDVTVSFARTMPRKAVLRLARMDGVSVAEPVRHVPAVLRNGVHSYQGAVTGLVDQARLYRAIDSQQAQIAMRPEGILLSRTLAGILRISPGDMVTVEVREGSQPVLTIPVVGFADSSVGAPAYMELSSLNRALGQEGRASAAYLRVDAARADGLYERLKEMPMVLGIGVKEQTRGAMQKMMDQGAGSVRYVMLAIAAIITFGIVYNSARIAQAERSRDIASLRVIGFTRGEAGFVLLGELAVVVLVAIPLGSVLGHYLCFAIAEGFSTDIYQVKVAQSPLAHGQAGLAVLGAALVSGLLVKRDIDRVELVSALKTRE